MKRNNNNKKIKKIKSNHFWLQEQLKSWDKEVGLIYAYIYDNYDVIGLDYTDLNILKSWKRLCINKNDFYLNQKLDSDIEYLEELFSEQGSFVSCLR